MKTASIVLTSIGIALNFLWLTGSFYSSYWTPILNIIGCTIGVITLVSLGNNTKNTAIGILCAIFTSILGGIFYLCWNPYKE